MCLHQGYEKVSLNSMPNPRWRIDSESVVAERPEISRNSVFPSSIQKHANENDARAGR